MAVTRVKRKKGFKFKGDVWIDGVKVASKILDTSSAAHAWSETYKKKLLNGTLPKETSLGECVQSYLISDFTLLRKQSQQSRASRFIHIMNSPMAKIKMGEVRASDIDLWLEWLRDQPTAKTKGRKSFIHELKSLNVVFVWYREEKDHSFINPILKRHRQKKVFFKEVPQRRKDYFIREQDVMTWIGALRKRRDPVYHRFALYMILTGWRMGEVAGLHWSGVDLESDPPTARVEKTMWWDYKTKKSSTQNVAKTDSSIRFVILPKVLAEMLRLMRKDSQIGLVFRNSKGGPLRDNTIRDNFTQAFKACGLPWTATHICRHTFGTLGMKASRDKVGLQAVMGHSSMKQTEEYAKIIYLQDSLIPQQMAEIIGLK